MPDIEKIIIITKKTWLEELVNRFNTIAQAQFYIDQNLGKGHFDYYRLAHEKYHKSLDLIKKIVSNNYRYQVIEREFLPNFLFNKDDLIITVGPDGLVINTAKYLQEQRILAINPDSERIDGVLIPFNIKEFSLELLENIEKDNFYIEKITMAKAELNTNQVLYGVNDIFIGHKSHMSARYSITYRDHTENHSSSGIIVSTGTGSTGWLRSIITGAIRITKKIRGDLRDVDEYDYKFDRTSRYLVFSVREPFVSKLSKADICFGEIFDDEYLEIESKMPENGVIFSDGIESDYLNFNSGIVAKIGIAEKNVNLILNN
ncbi:MAG: sugar kinase [Promethearchaeota archaeon]